MSFRVEVARRTTVLVTADCRREAVEEASYSLREVHDVTEEADGVWRAVGVAHSTLDVEAENATKASHIALESMRLLYPSALAVAVLRCNRNQYSFD